jgi:hypothetical protein
MARFGSAARGDPLYEVGVGIGRLLRTIFLADYFVKPAFRRELLRVLNRGEATNALKRLIYTDGVAIVRCSPPGSGYSPSSPQLVTSRSTSKKALQLMCPHCLLGGRIPLTARATSPKTFGLNNSASCMVFHRQRRHPFRLLTDVVTPPPHHSSPWHSVVPEINEENELMKTFISVRRAVGMQRRHSWRAP